MGLRAFVIRRLLLVIPTLLGAVLLIFAVSQLFPVKSRVALYITNPQRFKPEVIERTIHEVGLDAPVYVQFFNWLQQVLGGNLGWSETAQLPVSTTIAHYFPATLEIVIFTAPVIIFLGIYLGVLSAVRRDTPIDHATRSISIIGASLPAFWLGILLLAIFFVALGWFQPGRLSAQGINFVYTSPNFIKYTGLMTVDGLLNGQLWITIDALRHLVLPLTVLTTIGVGGIIRLMRSSMLEALNKGYIVTARAKGLAKKEVINKHARRNALIPTVTVAGLMVAGMMNGLMITETVFAFGGLGQWSVRAAVNLDVAGVLGFALFTGFLFVISNLIVDILYAYIDPRIRLD